MPVNLVKSPTTRAAALLGLCLIHSPSFALEEDRYEPITIQADAAMVNDVEGISVYKGSVTIEQGTLHVMADEVEMFTDEDEVIQIIAKTDLASESLAHYEQQINAANEMVSAEARKITYLVQEQRLHLSGDATLNQAGDIFSGELLYYDIPGGIVNLVAGPGPSDRVNLTITPNKPDSDVKPN